MCRRVISYVQSRLCFESGIVVCAVHREGKRVVIAGKNRRGAVALVDVAVDYRRATDPSRAHCTNRDRHVVQYTKPFAAIGEGVMRAAGKV